MSKLDLDKYPTSEAAKRMLRRVSPVYQSAYTAKWLYQVMGLEWDEARDIVLSLRDQAFTQSVTWGIEMQEHKYSIKSNDNLSLEERRARLFRRKTIKYPLNPRRAEIYFSNSWGMEVDIDETTGYGILKLSILSSISDKIIEAIKDFIRIKPSHLTLVIESKREVDTETYVSALASSHRRYISKPKLITDVDVSTECRANSLPSLHHRIMVNPRVNNINDVKAQPTVGGKTGMHIRIRGGVMKHV